METMAEERRFIVSVSGGHRVTVIDSSDSSSSSPLFVYAPGAGSSLDDPFGRWLAQELSSEGIHLWRLQFPYMEAKRKAPDRAPVLEATWRAVASEAGPKAVFGGRSMGGRIALRSLQTERQPSGWPSSRIRSTRLAGRIACATSISAQSKFPPSSVRERGMPSHPQSSLRRQARCLKRRHSLSLLAPITGSTCRNLRA